MVIGRMSQWTGFHSQGGEQRSNSFSFLLSVYKLSGSVIGTLQVTNSFNPENPSQWKPSRLSHLNSPRQQMAVSDYKSHNIHKATLHFILEGWLPMMAFFRLSSQPWGDSDAFQFQVWAPSRSGQLGTTLILKINFDSWNDYLVYFML